MCALAHLEIRNYVGDAKASPIQYENDDYNTREERNPP
jgi:hypothetical protein